MACIGCMRVQTECMHIPVYIVWEVWGWIGCMVCLHGAWAHGLHTWRMGAAEHGREVQSLGNGINGSEGRRGAWRCKAFVGAASQSSFGCVSARAPPTNKLVEPALFLLVVPAHSAPVSAGVSAGSCASAHTCMHPCIHPSIHASPTPHTLCLSRPL